MLRPRVPKIFACALMLVASQGSFSANSSGFGSCFNESTSSASSSSASSAPSSPLTCTVTQQNAWAGGYNIDVKITNTGAVPTDKWAVVLDMNANQTLESAWNAAKLASDTTSATLANISWNGTLAPKSATSFGATIKYAGDNAGLPRCRLVGEGRNDDKVNRAPVADVSTSVFGATVQVRSLNVSDPDGDKLTYTIDFGDNKKIVFPEAWHTYEKPGTYKVTLTVSDGKDSTVVTKEITVSATDAKANHAPVAMMQYDSSMGSIRASAAASADPEGSALTYQWNLGSQAFTGSSAAITSADGVVATLTVFDGQLGDTRQESIPSSLCVAFDFVASADFSYETAGLTVQLNAAKSSNTSGFEWDFGDGTKGKGLFASHTYAKAGTYNVSLRALGGFFSGIKTIAVTVAGDKENNPPVPCFTMSPGLIPMVMPMPAGAIQVDASCSKDADGDALTYSWSFGDGGVGQAGNTGHIYKLPGTYNVSLTVSDGKASATTSKIYQTREVISKPDPCFTVAVNVRASNTLIADASCTTNADGSALSYAWDFGDGTKGTGLNVSHTFKQGTYNVTLTVTTSASGINSVTKSFTAPLATITPCTALPVGAPSLSGYGTNVFMASADCSRASDGSALSFAWDFGDGTKGAGASVSHAYTKAGTYDIVLSITSPTAEPVTVHIPFTPVIAAVVKACMQLPAAILPNNQFLAQGGCSTSSDGSPLSYLWNFGDGATATGLYASHNYAKQGTYKVTLTVQTAKGASDTTSINFTSFGNPPPKTSHCEFKITSEWSSGYTAFVRVYNDSKAPMSGWDVNLGYTTNRISNAWNTSLTGTNPYTAKNAGWNGSISPSSYVEFGFQVDKKGGAAETPVLSGASCL